jgi:hypothetical protein
MKKYIIAVLVLTLVGAAAAWYYLRSPVAALAPSQVLPQSTLLTVELVNLEQTMHQLHKSTFAQRLRSIDIPAVMAALDIPPEKIKDYKKGKEAFFSTINSPLFRELFGQNVALALLPPGEASTPAGPLSELLDSAVLISRPKHRADLVELLSQVFTKDLRCETQRYGDYEIKTLALDEDIFLHYALVQDLMVASCSLPRLHSCLDLTKPGAATLDTLPCYRDLTSRLATAHLRGFCFVSTGPLAALIKEIATPLAEGDQLTTAVPKALAMLQAFVAIGAAAYDDGSPLLRGHALALVNQEHAQLVRQLFGGAPEQNATLPMTLPQPLLYHWGSNLDLQTLWNGAFGAPETGIAEDRTPSQDTFERSTGVQLKDLFAAFGNQYAFLVTGLGTTGPFPIPRLGLMAEVADEAAARNVLTSLVRESRMPVDKKTHEDIEITYLSLPFGKELQPSYAFLNGFCVMSLSRTLLKEMITALHSGKSITSDPDFRLVTAPISGTSTSLTFVRVAPCAAELQELAKWAKGIIALRDPNSAATAAALIDGVVNPVLECFKEIKAIGSRTVVRPTEIEAETYCAVER